MLTACPVCEVQVVTWQHKQMQNCYKNAKELLTACPVCEVPFASSITKGCKSVTRLTRGCLLLVQCVNCILPPSNTGGCMAA